MFQCGFRRQQTCLPIHGETLQATNILRRIGKKDLSAWYVHTHGTHISAVYLCLLLYETSVRVYLYGCPSACLTLSESVYTDVMRWMVVCVCEYVCMPNVLCVTLSVKTKDRWLRYIATVTGETSSQQAYSLAG